MHFITVIYHKELIFFYRRCCCRFTFVWFSHLIVAQNVQLHKEKIALMLCQRGEEEKTIATPNHTPHLNGNYIFMVLHNAQCAAHLFLLLSFPTTGSSIGEKKMRTLFQCFKTIVILACAFLPLIVVSMKIIQIFMGYTPNAESKSST